MQLLSGNYFHQGVKISLMIAVKLGKSPPEVELYGWDMRGMWLKVSPAGIVLRIRDFFLQVIRLVCRDHP